jgi:hypothetical protein
MTPAPLSANPPSSEPTGKSGLLLTEEAILLLRRAPFAVTALYYIGTLPFMLGFVEFWSVLRHGPSGARQLPLAAFGLALLFLWMKAWQARYCRRLYALLRDDPLPSWGLRGFLRTAVLQGCIQATGFLVLPVAVLLTAPFGWVYAAYQNALVLDDERYATPRALFDAANIHARLWPKQNHIAIWLLSPFLLLVMAVMHFIFLPALGEMSPALQAPVLIFVSLLSVFLLLLNPLGVCVAVNVGLSILALNGLLQVFFDIRTIFTVGGPAIMNSSFEMLCVLIAWLLLDPAMKAAYVIRCFDGDALKNGEDLRVALRRYAVAALLLFAGLAGLLGGFSPTPVAAQSTETPDPAPSAQNSPPSQVDAQTLNKSIDDELSRLRYVWRLPKERDETQENAVVRAVRSFFEWAQDLVKRIRDYFKRQSENDSSDKDKAKHRFLLSDVRVWMRILLAALCVVIVGVLLVTMFRMWRRRRVEHVEPALTVLPLCPDLENEGLAADQLPENEWAALAQDLAGRGEYRLAMRALYLAGLAHLAQAELLRLARYKSNRDYLNELRRRAHFEPALPTAFAQCARLYESVWYGKHEAAAPQYLELSAQWEQLRGAAHA